MASADESTRQPLASGFIRREAAEAVIDEARKRDDGRAKAPGVVWPDEPPTLVAHQRVEPPAPLERLSEIGPDWPMPPMRESPAEESAELFDEPPMLVRESALPILARRRRFSRAVVLLVIAVSTCILVAAAVSRIHAAPADHPSTVSTTPHAQALAP